MNRQLWSLGVAVGVIGVSACQVDPRSEDTPAHDTTNGGVTDGSGVSDTVGTSDSGRVGDGDSDSDAGSFGSSGSDIGQTETGGLPDPVDCGSDDDPFPAWVTALPVGDWAQLPGTDFSTSDARITFSDGSRSHPGAVGGWAGWAYEPCTGLIYQTGGGHSDGADNSIYALTTKADVPEWTRPGDGTVNVDDRVEYVNTPNGTVLSVWNADGKPTATHAYHSMHIVQGLLFFSHFYCNFGDTRDAMSWAPNNEPWMIGFDTVTNTWPPSPDTYATPPFWDPTRPDNAGLGRWATGTDGQEYFLVTTPVDVSGVRLTAFDPATNTWRVIGPDMSTPPHAVGFGGKVSDVIRRQIVETIEGDPFVYLYSMDAGGREVVALTGPEANFAANWNSSYMGVVHDTRRDVYYAMAGQAATGKNVYRIDPNDAYSTDILPVTGDPADVVVSGLNNRMVYIHRYDTILIHPGYDTGVWALRLSEDS